MYMISAFSLCEKVVSTINSNCYLKAGLSDCSETKLFMRMTVQKTNSKYKHIQKDITDSNFDEQGLSEKPLFPHFYAPCRAKKLFVVFIAIHVIVALH